MTHSLAFLRKAQNEDGGFGQSEGYRSNAQSTAWAIQGIVAAGKDPSRFGQKGRSPLAFLASLRAGDGSYRYSRSSAQTPVWVTAQAIAAVRGKALPLRPPARRAKPARERARRTQEPALGHAAPEVERVRSSVAKRAVPAPPLRRALAARPVSAPAREPADSGGSIAAPAFGVAAAVLLAAAAGLLFRRRHV